MMSSKNMLKTESFAFLTKGLACQALCLLEYAGICNTLKNKKSLFESELFSYANPPLIRAACATLVGAKILSYSNGYFQFTELGETLYENISLMTLPLIGYRALFGKQFELINNSHQETKSEIDYATVATASVDFCQHDLDPLLLEVLQKSSPKGTVCDLGCGTGEKLRKFCEILNLKGLGIEKNPHVLFESRKFFQENDPIEIIAGDVTNLNGVWEDIDVVFLSMVFHDITPQKQAISFLSSLKTHFPRMRTLIIADIVSFSEKIPTILPGFDYVHGLQGIIPNTYEQTLEIFDFCNLKVLEEVKVPQMPNTFIWALRA